MDKTAKNIGQHYDEHIEYQKIRLEQDSPIEYEITKRVLNKWVKDKSKIAYIGVGVGHYALYLCQQKKCQFHLIDVSEKLLQASKDNFYKVGLSKNIISCTNASATDLSFIPNESVDVVLMLGPLYHLPETAQQHQAINEAHRILKKDGVLFASAINRLAILHELFNNNRFSTSGSISSIADKLNEYIQSGISNNAIFPQLGNEAYFVTVDEFTNLFKDKFTQLDLLGLESFTAFNQKKLFEKSFEEHAHWFNFVEKTARMKEGIASAEHLFYVGKK